MATDDRTEGEKPEQLVFEALRAQLAETEPAPTTKRNPKKKPKSAGTKKSGRPDDAGSSKSASPSKAKKGQPKASKESSKSSPSSKSGKGSSKAKKGQSKPADEGESPAGKGSSKTKKGQSKAVEDGVSGSGKGSSKAKKGQSKPSDEGESPAGKGSSKAKKGQPKAVEEGESASGKDQSTAASEGADAAATTNVADEPSETILEDETAPATSDQVNTADTSADTPTGEPKSKVDIEDRPATGSPERTASGSRTPRKQKKNQKKTSERVASNASNGSSASTRPKPRAERLTEVDPEVDAHPDAGESPGGQRPADVIDDPDGWISAMLGVAEDQARKAAEQRAVDEPEGVDRDDASSAAGTAKDGADGELPDDELPDGELPDDELPDGELPDGELPDDELPDGELSDDELPDGELPDGELPDDELPDGELPDDEVEDSPLPVPVPAAPFAWLTEESPASLDVTLDGAIAAPEAVDLERVGAAALDTPQSPAKRAALSPASDASVLPAPHRPPRTSQSWFTSQRLVMAAVLFLLAGAAMVGYGFVSAGGDTEDPDVREVLSPDVVDSDGLELTTSCSADGFSGVIDSRRDEAVIARVVVDFEGPDGVLLHRSQLAAVPVPAGASIDVALPLVERFNPDGLRDADIACDVGLEIIG